MTNSNNGDDYGSYKGNSSLPTVSGPAILPANPIMGDVSIPGPNPTLEANIPAPERAAGPATLPSADLNQWSRTLLPDGERRDTSKSWYGRVGSCRALIGSVHPC
ncbi:UNVERIFIED_CONTAM: hypothetical protein Slati_4246600 [Sesamum latifolium]|uniref:Uncharacterized protein n=1 Tax=Sesamum latifolium TaxID=2727402 RepID=A0AAW2TBY5_9LAMI